MKVSPPLPPRKILIIHYSLPLYFDLQILKLDAIYHLYISSFVYECHNNLALNYFSDYFTHVYLIFIITMLEMPPIVTFSQEKEHFAIAVWFTLFVLMKQKFGITSLLIFETLHQLETSRKRSNNCFWSLITQKFDHACSVWESLW